MAGLVKTFVCLPDGTVTAGRRSSKLRRLAAQENAPELIAVTVTAETSGDEAKIVGCGVNVVVPCGQGLVLAPRSYGSNVVPLPWVRPRIATVEAYKRLLGAIAGAFGVKAVMDAYSSVLWPVLEEWCADEVGSMPHLGPCYSTSDPEQVRSALERHLETQVRVVMKMVGYSVQAVLGEHLMWLEAVQAASIKEGQALVLAGSPAWADLRFGSPSGPPAVTTVALPYRPGEIQAEIFPDGLTVYSFAAGLTLDLAAMRGGAEPVSVRF